MPSHEKLRKYELITEQYEYKQVIGKGKVIPGRRFKAYVECRRGALPKAGFIAGRGVGGACERNRARRLLREAYRKLKAHAVGDGFRIVFVAAPGIAGAGLSDVSADMEALFGNCGLLKERSVREPGPRKG